MANPKCPNCGSCSHLWDVAEIASNTSRAHVQKTYICSSCKSKNYVRDYSRGIAVKPDTKQQWANPAETLDAVIGILTGLPIDETWGTDAIGTAQDVMREIMELRAKVNKLSRVFPDEVFMPDDYIPGDEY